MYKNWLKSHQNIREILVPNPLTIRHGAIPRDLKGIYYKASPGQFDKFGKKVSHPFDGDGYVSAYYFDNGKLFYQARFVNTMHRSNEELFKNRLYTGAFGTPPHGTFIKNPANTNVVRWGDYLIVFCESGAPYILDPLTLRTIGTLKPFRDGLPFRFGIEPLDNTLHHMGVFGDAVGAHPKIINDRLIIYSIVFENTHTRVRFYELASDFTILSTTDYIVDTPLYFIHDFQVTDDHYLFVEHNVILNTKNYTKGIVNCIEEHPTKNYNRVHIIPRPKTEKNMVISENICKEILPGFITHYAGMPITTNNTCAFWSIIYPHPIKWDDMEHIQEGALYKTIWDYNTNQIYQKRLTEYTFEFPTLGEYSDILDYQYVYALMDLNNKTQGTLVKLNLLEWKEEHLIQDMWSLEKIELFLGEPMYANGYILATCYDASKNESLLYIFDSKNLKKGPICMAELPYPSPIGLHGYWYSKQPKPL